jgi:hypothetical protein
MEELHTDSIDGGHEASYGARSRARERAYSNKVIIVNKDGDDDETVVAQRTSTVGGGGLSTPRTNFGSGGLGSPHFTRFQSSDRADI